MLWLVGFLMFMFNVFALPSGFVYLSDVAPEIEQNIRYYSEENFMGKRITGYNKPIITLTKEASIALKKANEELKKDGFRIVVYDGYRPQMAVDEFVAWESSPDISKKENYFPNLTKPEIFQKGFIVKRSSHSRGSTVDLTIIEIEREVCPVKPVKRNGLTFLDDCTYDFGMHFDFFGPESWSQSKFVSSEFNRRRAYLAKKLVEQGFSPYPEEWWHFTLKNEPFPKTYFNFEIK